MIRALVLAVAVLCAMAAPAHAARFSGAYLLGLCEMDAKGHEKVKGGHAACQAYISGVLDYHTVLQSLGIAPQVDICVPDRIGVGQLHAIVLDYLRNNKQHDSFVAAPAVTLALYGAYPCRKTGKKK